MLLDCEAYEVQEEYAQKDYSSDNTQLDPAQLNTSTVLMLGILELLHAEHLQGRSYVSLAVICKRLDIRMSTLQRLMTALSEESLVDVFTQKERLVATLAAGGEEISLALQAA
nr:hypothetical protein [uncultured Methylotenera sp.]